MELRVSAIFCNFSFLFASYSYITDLYILGILYNNQSECPKTVLSSLVPIATHGHYRGSCGTDFYRALFRGRSVYSLEPQQLNRKKWELSSNDCLAAWNFPLFDFERDSTY